MKRFTSLLLIALLCVVVALNGCKLFGDGTTDDSDEGDPTSADTTSTPGYDHDEATIRNNYSRWLKDIKDYYLGQVTTVGNEMYCEVDVDPDQELNHDDDYFYAIGVVSPMSHSMFNGVYVTYEGRDMQVPISNVDYSYFVAGLLDAAENWCNTYSGTVFRGPSTDRTTSGLQFYYDETDMEWKYTLEFVFAKRRSELSKERALSKPIVHRDNGATIVGP